MKNEVFIVFYKLEGWQDWKHLDSICFSFSEAEQLIEHHWERNDWYPMMFRIGRFAENATKGISKL